MFMLYNKLQMKLVDSNPIRRKRSGKVTAFTAFQRESLLKVPSSDPIELPQYRQGNSKVQMTSSCPESPPNKIFFLGDKSITTRVQTNHIYDSIKVPLACEAGPEWRILTLKQLKRDQSANKGHDPARGDSRSRRGIDVSISKRNRKTVSSENKGYNCSYSDEKEYRCLRKLSTRGRLIDKIQLQMQNSNKEGIFFC